MGNISVTAVIANKVATLAMQDSTITIEGESARAKFLQGFLDYYLGDRMDVAAEVALGTGDCIVKPYTDGKRLGVDIVKMGLCCMRVHWKRYSFLYFEGRRDQKRVRPISAVRDSDGQRGAD